LCDECQDCKCKSYLDFDFHTDRHSFSSIEKLASEKLVILFSQMDEDKLADTTEDSNKQGAMIHR
jgi:hypothetical protein